MMRSAKKTYEIDMLHGAILLYIRLEQLREILY